MDVIEKAKLNVKTTEAAVRKLVKDGAKNGAIAEAKERRRAARSVLRLALKNAAIAPTLRKGREPKPAHAPLQHQAAAADPATSRSVCEQLEPLVRAHGIELVLRALSSAIILADKTRAAYLTAWSVQELAGELAKGGAL